MLYALSADIAAMGRLSPSDLVELVKDDDAILCSLGVVVGFYEKSLNASLDVLPDVAGLREAVAVAYGKRNVQLLAECPIYV